MKNFARVAALVLVASAAFSGNSFAASTPSVSASVTSQQGGSKDPSKSPIPTCPPDAGCTFPIGR